ncbi:MAG: hypothetical protein ACTHNS_01475 [Marmoricola sp.]
MHRPAVARPRQDRPTPARLVLAVVLVLLAVATAGCARQGSALVPPTPTTPSPTGVATTTAATAQQRPPRDPVVVDWGMDARVLSIVVRNADDREIRRGLVQIALYDTSGRLLLATTGPSVSKCCTLLSVPPGRLFGLYVLLPDGLDGIANVTVGFARPTAVAVRSWPASRRPQISVGLPTFTRTATNARVSVTLTPRSKVPAYVAGQAFLEDRRDHLVAVISGHFYCFEDDARRITMGLRHPVPPGTHVGGVVAYPIPPGVHPHVPYSCRTSTETP